MHVYHHNTVSNTRICKSMYFKTGLVALIFFLYQVIWKDGQLKQKLTRSNRYYRNIYFDHNGYGLFLNCDLKIVSCCFP